ncbi:hypothetical protein ZHAS_00010174 [Anopheles sinensis]|uniref:Uncharacterized protein n=1 Tax=Anopheles sinensis TaxID=74873 RepID=A0A084VWW9_ANOSI|nr:hypothetical protein ZHAS_00010174 [Anopheles sinensis]
MSDPILSSTAKVARWFHTLQWTNQTQSLSRPESGFVSGDSRSERNQKSDVDMVDLLAKDHAGSNGVDLCDEYLLVEGTSNLWSKLSPRRRWPPPSAGVGPAAGHEGQPLVRLTTTAASLDSSSDTSDLDE